MICPSCHAEGAYIGFSSVECQSSTCSHYKPVEKSRLERHAELRFGEVSMRPRAWTKEDYLKYLNLSVYHYVTTEVMEDERERTGEAPVVDPSV
jgi:hypothetical protein